MSDRLCPCDARLDRSSAVRSLASTTKVCNVCRYSYKNWRRENPEFSGGIGYMDSGDSEIEGSDTNSVRDGLHSCVSRHREFFLRLIRWIRSL